MLGHSASGPATTNLYHLRFSQFRMRVAVADLVGSVNQLVSDVVAMRSPAEILRPIISLVAIPVAALHSFRRWSVEGDYNDSRESPTDLMSMVAERNFSISVFVYPSRHLTPFASNPAATQSLAPDAAIAPNSISGESFDIPIFDTQGTARHGGRLVSGRDFNLANHGDSAVVKKNVPNRRDDDENEKHHDDRVFFCEFENQVDHWDSPSLSLSFKMNSAPCSSKWLSAYQIAWD
ncbi:MAG: hypothetical protein NT069_29210 [Planctomycetota bacterium]|nr:hypothetical protein [Planctomycetota bacterium]